MSSNLTNSNNKKYRDMIGYKHDKACIGINCTNKNTNLFQISISHFYAYLCNNCKISLEQDGWILNNCEYSDDKKESKV